MGWPAIKKAFTQAEFAAYVETLRWDRWRPSLVVLHNTAAPTLAQWHATAEKDKAADRTPGQTRIVNLEIYFRDQRKWSGGPHLFIADDLIWVFNPLTEAGVHSPSWNGRSIGIEMVADFDREDDDSGAGLKVRQNTVFATAVLCTELGLDPSSAVKLHREDPRTTHKCPGEDFARDKAVVIQEIEALLSGGEHSADDIANAIDEKPPARPLESRARVMADDLNLRSGAGVTHSSKGKLPKGLEVVVLDSARNGTTEWFFIRTPYGVEGWAAGRFLVKLKE
jgi:hypothetical protein